MFKQICKTLFQRTKMLSATYNNVQKCCSSNITTDLETERIIWMDLEMTGLQVETCHIMEVACIVTDGTLNTVAEGPNIIIHQSDEILHNMDDWCINQHGNTGLTEECRSSSISLKDAEKQVLNFIQEYTQPGMSPLAGNTVYMDRLFLKKYMPNVDDHIHHRIIDVSTVKELCRRWNPEVYKSCPKKKFLHRSLQDIRESIEELRWYRDNFIKIN